MKKLVVALVVISIAVVLGLFFVDTPRVPLNSLVPQQIRSERKLDITQLRLGDGFVSTSPRKGYVYSCQTSFSKNSGGAQNKGSWIHGDTWDLTEKLSVQGSISWPQAWFSEHSSGESRVLLGNGLPVGSSTGLFPIAKDDPAYQIDRNPNSITEQDTNFSIPSNPQLAEEPSCVPMGVVGVMLNGVAVFNALDARGDDAVAHEVQDNCNGHPEMTGEYHYHGPSSCVPGDAEPNKLLGYALDGFGIYSGVGEDGTSYTNDDLDECHGMTSEVEWNGKMTEIYHYVMTQEYPYTIGCFKGSPVIDQQIKKQTQNEPGMQRGTDSQRMDTSDNPPSEAVAACVGKENSSQCTITTPKGVITGTCQRLPGKDTTACVPVHN